MALTLTDDQATALLDALGLPADTDDADLVVQTAADLADQAGDPAKPSTIAASAMRAGLEVLDVEAATALRRDAAAGRQAAAAAKAKVEASVDDAVAKGKITPSRRKHWVNVIEADPGMAAVLASVPAEASIPLSETGHADEHDANASPGWFY